MCIMHRQSDNVVDTRRAELTALGLTSLQCYRGNWCRQSLASSASIACQKPTAGRGRPVVRDSLVLAFLQM